MHHEMSVRPPSSGLRGNYSIAGADFQVVQDWAAYSEDEHALWRALYARQNEVVRQYACPEYLSALSRLDLIDGVPRFDLISARLQKKTGWQIIAVPGLIPDQAFFEHLANRRFPVTVWLRRPEEFDYIVEPDVFHDFYGHVPLLFDPIYANHMQAYGIGGLKALRLGALKFLARLYWYSIEFGLMRTPEGLRAYGAGLLSSVGELEYSIDSSDPQRLPFDCLRVMRTEYRIDAYQDVYFVINDFDQLLRDTAPDFAPYYAGLAQLDAIPPGTLLPEEHSL
jgi:phenylalanine-4-hydroxylase